jgi:hypothetical protein
MKTDPLKSILTWLPVHWKAYLTGGAGCMVALYLLAHGQTEQAMNVLIGSGAAGFILHSLHPLSEKSD